MAAMPRLLKIFVNNPGGPVRQAFAENNGLQVAE
jgi:hypothetical protein